MNLLKRTAAAASAFAIAAMSFGSCASAQYCMTANGENVNAGIYINYILSEMTTQMYTMYYSGTISEVSEMFDQEIDGEDFTTYVKNAALDDVKELIAIEMKFDELGLSLSEEDENEISESVSETWSSDSEYYEYEGISKESLTRCYETSYKYDAIFDYYYDEGGIEEVSDDEMWEYVNENYLRYKYIYIAKSTEEDEDVAAEEDEASYALLESYIEEAEGMSFEEFDTIIDEYEAYQEALEAEEEESDDEEETSDEDESADESADEEETSDEDESTDESADDEETSDEDESTDESADEEETSDEDESTDESADEDESTDESTDEEDEEEEDDPYANEIVFDYSDYLDEESDSYDEDYAEMIQTYLDAEYETAAIYEDDSYYYLYMTADIADRTDYIDDNRDTLLDSLKGDEFDELVDGWIEEIDFVLNEKAIKKYTVREAYERQEEYYA